jgi:hypothetical protein
MQGDAASGRTRLDHIIRSMRTALQNFGLYPESLSAGSGSISGTAFFPGGDGVLYPRAGDIVPDILVVGHDFGSLSYFADCVRRREERMAQATWRGLLDRFVASGIDPQRGLFTNAFVGFRQLGGNVGSFPARFDRDYVERCRQLLLRQVELVRPMAIIALGTAVPSFLAPLSPQLRPWSKATTLPALDRAGALVRGARFGDSCANVCVLVHPSYARLNVGRRSYRDRSGTVSTGAEAEVSMLREAVETAAEI